MFRIISTNGDTHLGGTTGPGIDQPRPTSPHESHHLIYHGPSGLQEACEKPKGMSSASTFEDLIWSFITAVPMKSR